MTYAIADQEAPPFTAADCDGLTIKEIIEKHVLGPHAKELGDVLGATRDDGWTWLQADKESLESLNDAGGMDFEGEVTERSYCFDAHGIAIVHYADRDMREIADIRFAPLAGAALRSKQRDWLKIFLGHKYWPWDRNFFWPIDLREEALIFSIKSWGEFANPPAALATVRPLAKHIIKRWRHFARLMKQGELIAVSHNSGLMSGNLFQGGFLIDIRSGNCGGDIRNAGMTNHAVLYDCQSNPMVMLPAPIDTRSADTEESNSTEQSPSDVSSRPSIARAQKDCEKWLINEMSANANKRPWSKDRYLGMAQGKFDGLSERSFDMAWKTAIHRTDAKWDRAGRPAKNPRT